MTNTITIEEAEHQIERYRIALDEWLAAVYAEFDDRRYYGEMDAGYEKWGEIESVVGQVFDDRLTSQLSSQSLDSLLFFISRSDEIGCIIAWLYPETGSDLSAGDLTYDDFIFLCDQSLLRADDYCDYQLVVCFQKLTALNEQDLALLKRYFDTKSDSYTRRMVLHAFAKFRLAETIPLAERLWKTDASGFAKISCLYALEPFRDASGLLDQYLQEYELAFPAADADYRQTHLDHFRARKDDKRR